MAVRGLAASYRRSTIRLKLMAQVRAQTIAARIRRNLVTPGQPRSSRAAMAIEARANGKAKTVWEIFTNSPHFCSVRNIQTCDSHVMGANYGEQTKPTASLFTQGGARPAGPAPSASSG